MSPRTAFVLRRLLTTIPTLLAMSVFVFLLIRLVPGGPVRTMLGFRATPENVTTVRAQLHLDDPLPAQYFSWLTGIFAGDLGLYGLGYAARNQRWARARLSDRHIERGRRWLSKRFLSALIVARFIPGARLPAYAASGYLRVPFARFVTITAGAGIVWTLAIFAIVMSVGTETLIALGAWKWLIGAALLLLFLAAPRLTEQADV